jgi:hypothetical protein
MQFTSTLPLLAVLKLTAEGPIKKTLNMNNGMPSPEITSLNEDVTINMDLQFRNQEKVKDVIADVGPKTRNLLSNPAQNMKIKIKKVSGKSFEILRGKGLSVCVSLNNQSWRSVPVSYTNVGEEGTEDSIELNQYLTFETNDCLFDSLKIELLGMASCNISLFEVIYFLIFCTNTTSWDTKLSVKDSNNEDFTVFLECSIASNESTKEVVHALDNTNIAAIKEFQIGRPPIGFLAGFDIKIILFICEINFNFI